MFDKNEWLVLNSDQYISHVKYSEISAFTYSEKDMQIQVFVNGNNTSFTFGFNDLDELKLAYETMASHLSPSNG